MVVCLETRRDLYFELQRIEERAQRMRLEERNGKGFIAALLRLFEDEDE
jgi:hypothetical protein